MALFGPIFVDPSQGAQSLHIGRRMEGAIDSLFFQLDETDSLLTSPISLDQEGVDIDAGLYRMHKVSGGCTHDCRGEIDPAGDCVDCYRRPWTGV